MVDYFSAYTTVPLVPAGDSVYDLPVPCKEEDEEKGGSMRRRQQRLKKREAEDKKKKRLKKREAKDEAEVEEEEVEEEGSQNIITRGSWEKHKQLSMKKQPEMKHIIITKIEVDEDTSTSFHLGCELCMAYALVHPGDTCRLGPYIL